MKLAKDITTTDLMDLGFEVLGTAMRGTKGRVSVTLEGPDGVVIFVHSASLGEREEPGTRPTQWVATFTGSTPAATIMAVLSTCPADSKEGA